jgi:hypothetical protein
MKWNISVIRGKNTNKYFVSTGEGMRKIKKIKKFFRPKKYKKRIKKILSITTEGISPVLFIFIFLWVKRE